MEAPLAERKQAFELLLPAVTESDKPNAEFVITALSSIKVRDALLKSLSDSDHITQVTAIENLFDVGTQTYGEVITDWSADLLGTLAGLSMLQFQHNEAKMYANAGADKGNTLSKLIYRSLTFIPPDKACSIFTDSMNAVTLDECLED